MPHVERLTKLFVKRTQKETEYATETYVNDSLRTIEAKYSLPVLEALRFLEEGRADSVSLNKQTPYVNFHATRFRDRIRVSIRETSRDVELELHVSRTTGLLHDEPTQTP